MPLIGDAGSVLQHRWMVVKADRGEIVQLGDAPTELPLEEEFLRSSEPLQLAKIEGKAWREGFYACLNVGHELPQTRIRRRVHGASYVPPGRTGAARGGMEREGQSRGWGEQHPPLLTNVKASGPRGGRFRDPP